MFWYDVAPGAGAKWSVLFEGQAWNHCYDDRDAAIGAAAHAAEMTFSRQGIATGVRVQAGDEWKVGLMFGDYPHARH